jgi:hypothetical protein
MEVMNLLCLNEIFTFMQTIVSFLMECFYTEHIGAVSTFLLKK